VAVEGHCGVGWVVPQPAKHHRVLALIRLRHLHLSAQRLEQPGQVLGATQALVVQRLWLVTQCVVRQYVAKQ
jgi:hypothetical protein